MSTTARRAGVLGSPIAHSLSPILHRAAYSALDLPWTYERCEVTEETLGSFIGSLDDSWVGLSLTMPLKVAILPFAQHRSARVDGTGVANTLLITGDGHFLDNTDIAGVSLALAEAGVAPRRAAVVGAGATARSAVVALTQMGAEVSVMARREDAVEAMRRDLRLDLTYRALGVLHGFDAVVSTIPASAGADLVAAQSMPCEGVLLDAIYNPWPTPLAQSWTGPVIAGHVMLLHQAVDQVALMTGRAITPEVVSAMRAALLEALS